MNNNLHTLNNMSLKMKNKLITVLAISFIALNANAQTDKKDEVELKHYMPLYLDIPAEMNVKKGYKELNIAGGYADFKDFSGQKGLIEYDFAPIDKLGFEIEVPFTFVQEKHALPVTDQHSVPEEGSAPSNAMALRIGFNYALFASQEAKTSISVGYFNEFELTPFKHFGKPLLEGNVYNPFIAVAKIWGTRFHTMIYTGTATKQSFEHHETVTAVRFNTILTYRIGKANKESFVGIECNQTWAYGVSGLMVLRPQAQIQVTEKCKLGFVLGVPVATSNHLNASGFMRLIYTFPN